MGRMSATASDLLSQVEDAYSALLVAIANVNVQEYWTSDGRKIVRADFPRTLESLRAARLQLRQEVAAESGTRSRFTLAILGRPNGSSR